MSRITPRQRALLDTISFAEGTWDSKAGRPRYDITFGYQNFDPAKPHPRRIVRSGGYASDAAGAYQFLSTTWKGVKGGNKPMTPENQDLGALALVRGRGADPDQPLDAATLNRLAPEWASLPTTEGKSYYGQPVKNRDDLLKFYNQRLAAAGGPGASAAAGGTGGEITPAAALGPLTAAAGGGMALPVLSGSGGGGSSALLSLITSLSGGAGGSDPLLAAAARQQQQIGEYLDRPVSLMNPLAGAELEPVGIGRRQRAASPLFQQALNLFS